MTPEQNELPPVKKQHPSRCTGHGGGSPCATKDEKGGETSVKMTESRLAILKARLKETSFHQEPASAERHYSWEGGLAAHSNNVAVNLRYLTTKLDLKWADPESPEIIGYAHDACKIGAYIKDEDGKYHYNADHPRGHGELSVYLVTKWIELTEEEKACIRWHMGAFDVKENWNRYNEAIHRFPNVLFTHTADMMAAHIDEVEEGGP